MYPLLVTVIVAGSILTPYACQASVSTGVCNTTQKYTYTATQTTVTSYTTRECCNWFCRQYCDTTNYRATVTYYTVTANRTVFGCCAGFYQPSTAKQICDSLSCTDGDIKLVGGSTSNEGTLQVCANYTWGTVCDNNWSVQDATVACKQLGLSKYGATSYRNNPFQAAVTGGIVWKNVVCTGSETKLGDCRRTNNTSGCTHFSDVGVSCSSLLCRNGDIRLRGGPSQYEGRVEVCINEEWGSVCGERWDQWDAAVVCRQLGYLQYNLTSPLKVSSTYYKRPDSRNVLLSEMQCFGNETNLLGCGHGLGICDSTTDAGVNCQQCNDGELRLVGSINYEGGVEVCTKGQWGRICDDGWDVFDATVVCRQLGYSTQGSTTTNGFLYGSSVYPLLWKNVTCVGNESKLQECKMVGFWSLDRCNGSGVRCNPPYPGAPQNISANVFNSTSIIISWRPPLAEQTYGTILSYYFYSLFSEYVLSPTITSQQVMGLSPYTEYIFCVYASNSYGWGPYACIQVTTPPSVLTYNPTNFSVSVVNSTCIVLKWSPPVLSSYNGPLLNYSIEIIPQMDTTQRSLISTVQTFLIVSSLHPFYNYTCTVMAYTAAGKGPSTLPITVTTLQDVPSGPPVRFKATANGATSIAMEWGPPAPSNQNGIILGYTVTITTVMTGQIQRLNTTNTSIIVGLLKPYSDYYCSVAARTAIGSGPEAIPQLVQTKEGSPTGPPLNISHSTPNPSTLILNWSPPDPSYRNGVVREYLVVISEMETSRPLYFNTSTPPLSIPSLHPFYTYNCSVSAYTVGVPGPYSSSYLVRMPQSAPTSPPLNLSPVASTSTSVTLSWAPPPTPYQNGNIMGYILQVFNSQQGLLRETNTSSNGSTVNSLRPYTTYLFRVAAMTVAGRGPYSEYITAMTQQDAPSCAPTDLNMTLSSRSLQLSWSAPPSSCLNGLLTTFLVQVTEIATGKVIQNTSTDDYLEVTSLHPYYTYECVVAAATVVGPGPFSVAMSGRTNEDVPDGPPVNITITKVTPYSVTLQWNPPTPDKQNGVIVSYVINVMTDDQVQWMVVQSNASQQTISNLTPYTTYTFNISASTRIGQGPSLPYIVTTSETTPTGPPLNISHSTPNPSTLILNWSPPDPSYRNGVVRGYLVVISEMETSRPLYFDTSTPPLSIPSLHPFYTYNCSVSAYTVGLPGPYSLPYLVRMPQSAPTSPPLNLSPVTSTSTSVTLSWAPPPTQFQNGVIMGYTLQVFNSQQGLLRETNTSSNGSTVDSLNPDTTYLFKVAAMTVVGRGPYSDNVYVATRQFVPLIPPNVSIPVRLSAEAILLSWEPMATDTTQGALIGYSVRYRPFTDVAKRDTNQGYTITSTKETQITISFLDPTSAYMVGVAAATQAGIGVYSQNTVGLYENSLFQVYMQAPGVVCKEWMPYGTVEKTKDIVSQISSNLGSSFPITYIGDVGILCDKQQLNWVVFTGRAVGTRNLNSSGMVHHLQEWVLTSPKVTSQGVMLQVLASCSVFLTQLRNPSCIVAMPTTMMIEPSSIPVVGAVQSNTELTSVIAISGGIGGVLFILVFVVTAMICYVRRRTRATFIVGRVDGVNEMFKEMEYTKGTATAEPIYASITSLNGRQHETSECAQSCATDPLPSGDDLVDRAMPNPYAPLPLEQGGTMDAPLPLEQGGTMDAPLPLEQGGTMDDYVTSIVTEAAFRNDCINPRHDALLPVDCDRDANADGMTSAADNRANREQLNHATPSHVQIDPMPQEALKQDQAVDENATYSQVSVRIDTANDVYVCAERTDAITDQNTSSRDDATSNAMPLVSLPLEEDYMEMKST